MEEENLAKEYCVLYFDGALKTNSSGAGLVLQSPDGFMTEYVIKLDFLMINNKAEYEAPIQGLGLAGTLRVRKLKIFRDLRLVVSQVNGKLEGMDESMAK